jgi:uncharacterized membrane protein YphA (DoxX/SURF4 family)/peroxiredoxin
MMIVILFVRIALSAVFGTAGVTKLLDQRGTREAVRNFGAPEPLAPALAIILPFIELAIAAGLVFSYSLWWSAMAALLLLMLFVVAISINLARGNVHDCHCFGQLYSRPLGWSTLARNFVFAIGALFLLWQWGTGQPPGIVETLIQLNPVQWLIVAAAIFVTAVVGLMLQRRQKRNAVAASKQPHGLPLDSVAPPFELPAYDGGTRSLEQLLDYGKPVLLIFTSPNCNPCVVLFQEIKAWQHAHSERLTIALISLGTIKENFVNVARNRIGHVLLQEKREVGEKYGAFATPTAVLINTEGRIASHVAAGADEIRQLLLDNERKLPSASNNGNHSAHNHIHK